MKFLSPEWLDALGEMIGATDLGATDLGAAFGRARIGQVVTGAPGGDVAYTVVVEAGSASVISGTETAEATIVEDYETAREIARGTSIADLLYAGRVKVRGDRAALLAAQEPLGVIALALRSLNAQTEFEEESA